MPLKIQCPQCRKSLTVPDHLAGRTGKCPGCGVAIPIRAANEQIAARPPAPPPHAPASGAAQSPIRGPSTTASPAKSESWFERVLVPFIGGAAILFAKVFFFSSKASKPGLFQDALEVVLGLAIIGLVIWGVVSLVRWLIRMAADNAPATISSGTIPAPPSPSPAPPPPISHSTQWWLSFAGKATGPCSTEAVIDSLRCGDLRADTPVCPVGSNQWQPVSAWPEFAPVLGPR